MSTDRRDFKMIFPTVVHQSLVDGHDELNAQLQAEIDEIRDNTPNGRPASWSCDVYTTISNNCDLHERPGFKRLKAHFIESAEQYARAMSYSLDRYFVDMDMCWLNIYNESHAQERHTHINYPIGGCYYMKAPEGSAPITIHSPSADKAKRPVLTEKNSNNSHFHDFEPKEGMMLIFGGKVRHSVRVSTCSEERISIAMNAYLTPRDR